MGDRTAMQIEIAECPEHEVEAVCDILEEYGLGWDDGVHLGEQAMIEETSCGSSDEITSALREQAPGTSFTVWEDPKYEWLGSLNVVAEGRYFSAVCDSSGNAVWTSEQVLKMCADWDSMSAVREALGFDIEERVAELAVANEGKVLPKPEPVEIYARLTTAGTACAETALCTNHLDQAADYPGDQTGTDAAFTAHLDCSGNEALKCNVCGRVAR